MREILFRGQTRKYGEKVRMNGEKLPGNWVYGGIFPGTGAYSVIYGWEHEKEQTGANLKKLTVYSDTVGQYTGRRDKNGKQIFEGDVIRGFRYRDHGQWGENEVCTYTVEWDEKKSAFYPLYFFDGYTFNIETFEVIGNVHDNPEFMEAGT